MKKKFTFFISGATLLLITSIFMVQCTNTSTPKANGEMTSEQKIARGKYLVTAGACHDCHTPKIFTAMGPVVDTTRLLMGHPGDGPMPPIDTNALHPGYWVFAAPDLTMWVGPWGISYTANITPDSATGIGAWTEESFINTLRSGKHLGLSGGRPILPPMPWEMYKKLSDDDLKAIYAYLHSIPAIRNQVPVPVAPPDVKMMAMKK